jgi:copper transport protein
LLVIKTFAVGVTAAIGAYNHFVLVPVLEREPDRATVARRARTTVTLEAIVLLCVVIVTVFLKRASIN